MCIRDRFQAAIDRESRSLRASFYFAANARVNRGSHFCSICVCHLGLYLKLFSSLSRLQLDRNTRVTHALAFVSIRLAKLVHLGCDLAQLLLVDTGQRQRHLISVSYTHLTLPTSDLVSI